MGRAIPILLILWAVGAIGYALLHEEQEAGDAPDDGSGSLEPEASPALLTRGQTPHPASQDSEKGVPAWVVPTVARLHTGDSQKRLFAWLDEDPRNILLLMRARALGTSGATRLVVISMRTRSLFSTYGARLRACLTVVVEALKQPQEDDGYLAALLGAVAALPRDDPALRKIFAALARNEERPSDLRMLAADVLLASSRDADFMQETMELVLRAPGHAHVQVMNRVLSALQKQGPAGRPLLDALLEYHERVKDDGGWPAHEALRTMAAVAADDPRVRNRLMEAINSRNRSVRTVAYEILIRGPVDDVLFFLETAPAHVRVAGATALLIRGVAKDKLAPHVLAGLRSGGLRTREKAVQLLGKVGTNVANVLPIIEEHFASDDKGRWLSGVKALGALSTVAGDKRPVIDHLLAVGRRQDVKVRTAAVQAILMHDAQPAPVIELLTYLLDDSDAGVRAEAVDALGELSASHEKAKDALERSRTDPSPQVRELVVYWLDDDDD